MNNPSPLQKVRYSYEPKLPEVLKGRITDIGISLGEATESVSHQNELQKLFPQSYGAPVAHFEKGRIAEVQEARNIGVILSGGQAPGGHNVIAGLFDALKKANPQSILYGFKGGPSGIIDGDVMEISQDVIDSYRNTGGFDIIGSGRTKLETEEQFAKSLNTCKQYNITGVVIIGGDDSNTNGAILAEWCKVNNTGITVVGCPKTIDGDLKNDYIETSFGFDTATKTYSELIGNIQKDANSAKKYWHFIKLMGRSASHIALECALQSQPNICIISEEVKEKNMSLKDLVQQIADVVIARAKRGLNYGVVLIPEGLMEFIPEVGTLIEELNDLMAREAAYFASIKTVEDQREWINHSLSKDSSYVFSSLPRGIQMQLLDDRDPHGNVQFSRIETEKLLIELVTEHLKQLEIKGQFSGKFNALSHFFGYEGRCAFPSNFDADYCYGLGYSAFLLLAAGLSGYIANLAHLHKEASQWVPGGVPLTMMMNMEQRHGEQKPVIKKALVDLSGAPFKFFAQKRHDWAKENAYVFPGAIQYYGPSEICDQPSKTLALEQDFS